MKIKTTGRFVAMALMAGAAYGAQAQSLPDNYPNRPIRFICGTGPGSGSDIINRLIAAKLSERWGQSVIVENQAGAAGAIALDMIARAEPNGYTLSISSISAMTGWMTQRHAAFPLKSYTPIAQMTTLSYLLVVNPQLPVNSVKELIAMAKSKPGSLNYASAGVGSAAHLGMELFKSTAGVDIVHVPYKGSPQGLTALMAGEVQMQINNIIASSQLVKQGKLKALAVTSLERSKAMPDTPTMNEVGLKGFELENIQGLIGPAGMNPAILAALNKESLTALHSPDVGPKVTGDGAEIVAPHAPAQFRDRLDKQLTNWAKIILSSPKQTQ